MSAKRLGTIQLVLAAELRQSGTRQFVAQIEGVESTHPNGIRDLADIIAFAGRWYVGPGRRNVGEITTKLVAPNVQFDKGAVSLSRDPCCPTRTEVENVLSLKIGNGNIRLNATLLFDWTQQ